MRFLLYNIRYATGIGRHFHLPVPYSGYFKHTNGNLKKILNFIKLVSPDIIGLIEVDSGSFRSEKNNQAEAVAWELQHDHIYQSKYPASSMARRVPLLNKQGNAILTNQEIVSQKFHYFREGVVAGDFNAFKGDRELELFLAATGLKNANGNGHPSHPSRAPRRQLDYIFHSPQIQITDFQIPQIKLSDHKPLVCEFEIVSKKSPEPEPADWRENQTRFN